MLLRHGTVIAEAWWHPYRSSDPHVLYSLTKSFTSTAIGLAVSDGRLSIDDAIVDIFPEETPKDANDHLRALRVRHLLMMSTGHDADPTGAMTSEPNGDWVRGFFRTPIKLPPGSKFVYNNSASYLLSVIVEKRTGQNILDYLDERIFHPLGIEKPSWDRCPRGRPIGGWGLRLTTESIARFGQLYLQKGVWNGAQLVPESWVKLASSFQMDNAPNDKPDWRQGYGFQFWRCQHNAYRGDGAFGQYCIIMPDQDAVIAITGGVGPMQPTAELVWEYLLPAMRPVGQGDALPPNAQAAHSLKEVLKALALPVVSGARASSRADAAGKAEWLFDANAQELKSVSFHPGTDQMTLKLRDDRGEHLLHCGCGKWITGMSTYYGSAVEPVAASGAWIDANTFVARVCVLSGPFNLTLKFGFAGDDITFDYQVNVSFGPREQPRAFGHASG